MLCRKKVVQTFRLASLGNRCWCSGRRARAVCAASRGLLLRLAATHMFGIVKYRLLRDPGL
jgi:hypothetical protein